MFDSILHKNSEWLNIFFYTATLFLLLALLTRNYRTFFKVGNEKLLLVFPFPIMIFRFSKVIILCSYFFVTHYKRQIHTWIIKYYTEIKLYTYSSECDVISPMSFSHTQHIPELYKLSE